MLNKSNIFESFESISYEYSYYFKQKDLIDFDFDSQRGEINNFENFNIEPIYQNEEYPNTNNEENELFEIKSNVKHDDNFNAFTFKTPDIIDTPQKYVNEKSSTNLANVKTKATSLLTKKTKRSNENGENDEKKKNCGRKCKESNEKGNHNKFSEDNIMRKIKSNLLNYGHNRLNDSFEDKNLKFLKLDSDINENLKKDYNEKLMKTTLKELYETYPISSKYRKQKLDNYYHNKQIIKKIYEDNKEMGVKTILNYNYLDLLNEFKKFMLDNFLNEIRENEIKNGMSEENIEEYVNKIKKLCINYENWFLNKNGRNRKKNNQ